MNNQIVKKLHELFIEFNVKISAPSFVRKSKEMLENAQTEFGLAKGSATASIKLFNCDEEKEVRAASNSVRQFIAEHTVQIGSWNVTSPILFMELKQELDKRIARMEKAMEKFIANLDKIVEAEKTRLGTLFNARKYPTANQLREAYGVSVIIRPLPDVTAIHLTGMTQTVTTEISQTLESQMGMDFNVMCADLINKIIHGKNPSSNYVDGKPIGNGLRYAIYRLKKTREEKDKSFKDATFENVEMALDIVEKLNVANDSTINQLINETRALFEVEPESIRSNALNRDNFIDKAEKKLAELEKAMDGFLS